jgi:hypothetical protein
MRSEGITRFTDKVMVFSRQALTWLIWVMQALPFLKIKKSMKEVDRCPRHIP